jgi:cytochrome oxidase Cu insertion factor (SCO1/SenC/PrrC family)
MRTMPVLVLLGLFLLARPAEASSRLPDLGPAAALDLHDAITGRALPPLLHGKVVLLSFIASSCNDTCPMTEGRFARVQSLLQEARLFGRRVVLVLVGIDPAIDTPARLRDLAAKSGADPAGFHFAYGSPTATTKVLRDYAIDVHYHGASHTDPDHTVVAYLIDAHSRIRYDFAPQYPPAAIARITQRLVGSR